MNEDNVHLLEGMKYFLKEFDEDVTVVECSTHVKIIIASNCKCPLGYTKIKLNYSFLYFLLEYGKEKELESMATYMVG